MVARAGAAPKVGEAPSLEQTARVAPDKTATVVKAPVVAKPPPTAWTTEAARERWAAQSSAVAPAAAVAAGISEADFTALKDKMEQLRSGLEKQKLVPPGHSTEKSNDEGFMVCREQADSLAKMLQGKEPSKILKASVMNPKLLDLFKKGLPEGYSVQIVGLKNAVALVPGMEARDTHHAWVEVSRGKDTVTLDMWNNLAFRGEAGARYSRKAIDFIRTFRTTFPPLD